MFEGLKPKEARTALPQFLTGFMDLKGTEKQRAVEQLAASIADCDDTSLEETMAYLSAIGAEHRLYRSDPVAQRLTRAHMRILMSESAIVGVDNIRTSLNAGPTLLLSNHLAYCDTQIKDVLLHDHGAADLAEKLIVVAGPKVYEDAFRRVASMGLNTLQTAQSAGIHHNQTPLSPREIAAIALGTVRTAHERMARGEMILVYGEGTRSRSARLGPFLKAVRKYLQIDGCRVVPLAITGSERMMPVEGMKMRRSPVQLRIGAPIEVEGRGALDALEACWRAIADMLPDEYHPNPSTNPVI